MAAVVLAAGELGFLVRLGDTGCLSHRFLYSPALPHWANDVPPSGLNVSWQKLSRPTALLPYSKFATLLSLATNH